MRPTERKDCPTMTVVTPMIVDDVLDPVCEVVQPAIKGHDVTLTCRMVYDWQAPGLQFNRPPQVNVSLSWDGVSGTIVSTAADPKRFRGTAETNMTIESITTDTVPSHRCTVQFDFARPPYRTLFHYAVNSVSSTCVTKPVTVKS